MSAVALHVVGSEPDLQGLAETANREHALAVQSAQDLFDHALRAGHALLSAKAALAHGGFMRWVSDNCRFSHSCALNYMAVARNADLFKIAKPANLTQALAEIALTKVVKPSASDLENDELKADVRQAWLFDESELPLSPRDPMQQRDALRREDVDDFRCPCCATEWSGDPRPRLRRSLAVVNGSWRSQVPKEARHK